MHLVAKKVRIGIVGLGGAAQQMVPSFLASDQIQIAAAADPSADVREEFGAAFECSVYSTCEELAADPEVDCVYIASPHQWHRSQAITAARNGKHVIVEKPMALTLADCSKMIEAAEESGVFLIVGHTHSFGRPIKKAREIIRSGAFGRLAMINTFSYTNFLYKPRRPEEMDTSQGGGVLFNQLPHQVDMVRYLGGDVRTVRGTMTVLDPRRPTEGGYMAYVEFESGAAASLVYSGYDFFDSDEFHFWIGELGNQRRADEHASARTALGMSEQTQGVARKRKRTWKEVKDACSATTAVAHPHCGVTIISCERGDIRFSPRGLLIYSANGVEELDVPLSPAYPDKSGVVDEVVDAVLNGVSPVHDGRWGRATMEVCLALQQAANAGREVRLEREQSTAHKQ